MIIEYLTYIPYFKVKLAKVRRARYEELKAAIVQRHSIGFDSLVVAKGKYDGTDIGAFKYPMYQTSKDKNNNYTITWDPKKMEEEVGSYAVLDLFSDGEDE